MQLVEVVFEGDNYILEGIQVVVDKDIRMDCNLEDIQEEVVAVDIVELKEFEVVELV